MKIHWAVLTDYIGIGFGYSTHQKRLLEALLRSGVEISEDAEVAVHLTTADTFSPIEGKFNILYSMYECTTLPPGYIAGARKADMIVVPCKQNQRLFAQYVKCPVEVCWEGVENDKFTFYQRTFPTKRPFVFSWLGATNPRKGTEHIGGAWEIWNMVHPELRAKTMLVMKTTQTEDKEVTIEMKEKGGKLVNTQTEMMPAERIVRVAGNALVDTRKLPITSSKRDIETIDRIESLQEFYHYSHCFILPTRGEGWGLTLSEAAATGLPCIYTPWSGPRDFMDRKWGYPCKWEFGPVKTLAWNQQTGEKFVSHTSWGADPDINHIVRLMEQVYFGYEAALAKGRLAHKKMQALTWDASAKMLTDIIERHTKERMAA